MVKRFTMWEIPWRSPRHSLWVLLILGPRNLGTTVIELPSRAPSDHRASALTDLRVPPAAWRCGGLPWGTQCPRWWAPPAPPIALPSLTGSTCPFWAARLGGSEPQRCALVEKVWASELTEAPAACGPSVGAGQLSWPGRAPTVARVAFFLEGAPITDSSSFSGYLRARKEFPKSWLQRKRPGQGHQPLNSAAHAVVLRLRSPCLPSGLHVEAKLLSPVEYPLAWGLHNPPLETPVGARARPNSEKIM